MMDISFDNIGLLLNMYIRNLGEQGRLLPIVAMVYLLFELPSLSQFWLGGKRRLQQESDHQRCIRLLLAGYNRRTISAILIALLSGAFIMLSLLCQHYRLCFFSIW
jgi:hypothetical protein